MKQGKKLLAAALTVSCVMTGFPVHSDAAAALKLSKKSITIQVGQKKTLKVITSVSAKKVTWKTSSKKVCAVTANGKKAVLEGKKAGTADITCKAGGKKKVCKVTVKNKKTEEPAAALSKVDMSKWQYESSDDVYWQAGISYCANPADAKYETLGVYVPGAYFNAAENGDGTYTCQWNESAKVGNYTARTAPIVIPVNTPGYSAMSAPTGYTKDVASYTKEGFVYVYAGCRGRDAGAPAGVTDLKAAIRYIRYNDLTLPGSMSRIFSFGMSGGGAQSALLGATGDSELYTPYLEAIGAVEGISDAVAGSMCWCPITNLDYANEAYEWNLGNTRTGLSESEQKVSDGLAEAFAEYINAVKFKDASGNVLSLEKSDKGIYQSGTYYEYIKNIIETSLNHFLSDTEFPYTAGSSGQGGFGGPDGQRGNLGGNVTGGAISGGAIGAGLVSGAGIAGPGQNTANGNEAGYYAQDGIARNNTSTGLTGTYQTAKEYIDALNALQDKAWITYDSSSNTVKITDVSSFTAALKNASKGLAAFDALDRTQGENTLFGYGDGSGAHFDPILAELVKDDEAYNGAFADDLSKKDALGNTVDVRLNMYNPMYYLTDYYKGYGTSKVADHWRIRTGINQSDTALCTEVNLALALQADGKTVDFETVWGQGHTQAERSGDSDTNFIAWVNECLK